MKRNEIPVAMGVIRGMAEKPNLEDLKVVAANVYKPIEKDDGEELNKLADSFKRGK